MYYTSSGAYRKTKMIIDYANIFLTVCIGILFVSILFFQSKSGILFALIFMAGTIMNTISGIKKMLEKSTVSALFMFAAAVILLIMAVLCFLVI